MEYYTVDFCIKRNHIGEIIWKQEDYKDLEEAKKNVDEWKNRDSEHMAYAYKITKERILQ